MSCRPEEFNPAEIELNPEGRNYTPHEKACLDLSLLEAVVQGLPYRIERLAAELKEKPDAAKLKKLRDYTELLQKAPEALSKVKDMLIVESIELGTTLKQ